MIDDNDDDDKFKKLDPRRAELAGKNLGWMLRIVYLNLKKDTENEIPNFQ